MSKAAKGPAGPYALAVADEIRAELARRNLEQKTVVEVTGISSSYLSARLRGDKPFDLNDIETIAEALGMSPHTLLTRADLLTQSRGATAEDGYGPRVTGKGSVTGETSIEKIDQLKARRSATRRAI
ncbi:helix-turn-helix domain-containing protein [Nocardia panacis]|uniref:Helix-turn-helix domain-containing protein n=1 Tax=Nocardia panacis TaxID=2340916 RepID=A0A3A4KEC2_9NOCA|nr:helix-turn-helix transcriptional regulator [Nocardia panacis]RJO71434.1 helix-turn-helix domain-containing protein [Nocardia panacis]